MSRLARGNPHGWDVGNINNKAEAIASAFVNLRKKDSKMQKILKNRIRCKKCGDIIESTHRHDFKSCSCKSISIDGGHDYLRRVGDLKSYEDLSETVEMEEVEDELGGLNDYLRYRRFCKDNNVASNGLSRKSGESD